MSPTLQKGIGIAYINIPYNKVGTELLIDIRGKMKTAIVVKPPFYKAGTVLD
jgi:aminomethyltransferase